MRRLQSCQLLAMALVCLQIEGFKVIDAGHVPVLRLAPELMQRFMPAT